MVQKGPGRGGGSVSPPRLSAPGHGDLSFEVHISGGSECLRHRQQMLDVLAGTQQERLLVLDIGPGQIARLRWRKSRNETCTQVLSLIGRDGVAF